MTGPDAPDKAVQGAQAIQTLQAFLRNVPAEQVALVGVGDELRGDDGVGLWIVRQLENAVPFTVINASTAPENFIAPIARLAPEVVVVIDAVHAALAPGTMWCGPIDELIEVAAGTHCASLALFARAITERSASTPRFLLIGVQVQQTDFDTDLSPAVRQAAAEIRDTLIAASASA